MILATVERAGAATDAEHAAARDAERCPICGAAPGAECVYGAFGGQPGRVHLRRVHLRRARAYLARSPLAPG